LCTKLTWTPLSLSSSSLTHIFKFWSPSSFTDLESCSPTSGLLQPGGRTHLPGEGPGPPFLDGIQNPRLSLQIVGIKDPLVPKNRHTRERENLDKAISFDQKGASMWRIEGQTAGGPKRRKSGKEDTSPP
jgi:hypothetical protein